MQYTVFVYSTTACSAQQKQFSARRKVEILYSTSGLNSEGRSNCCCCTAFRRETVQKQERNVGILHFWIYEVVNNRRWIQLDPQVWDYTEILQFKTKSKFTPESCKSEKNVTKHQVSKFVTSENGFVQRCTCFQTLTFFNFVYFSYNFHSYYAYEINCIYKKSYPIRKPENRSIFTSVARL